MKKTLFDIPVNEKLIWDYEWSENEYQTEGFFEWYLARVLNNGNSHDLKSIDFEIIREYLPKLNTASSTQQFWNRYFERIQKK